MKNPFSMENTYHKVFIIDFSSNIQLPEFDATKLDKFGKWYKKDGRTWACEAKVSLAEFKQNILEALSPLIMEGDVDIKEGTWPIAVLGV